MLAGDALQALAFEVMLSEESITKAGAQRAESAAGILGKAIGADGMVGGQVIDFIVRKGNRFHWKPSARWTKEKQVR